EGVFEASTVLAIQVCLRINLPLKTKATRVVLRVHEAHDTIQHRILSSADRAHKSVCRLSQIISTGQAPQDPEHFFSGSEPILIFRFFHEFVHESQGKLASRSQPALYGSVAMQSCRPPKCRPPGNTETAAMRY